MNGAILVSAGLLWVLAGSGPLPAAEPREWITRSPSPRPSPPGEGGGAGGAEPPAAPAGQASGHPFACTDYSQGKVFLVGADGTVLWEYQSAGCNDLWVLPNGNH